MPTPHDWIWVSPEFQSAISHLAYLLRMRTFGLQGIYNFPISFFTSCTNITDLSIHLCGLQDYAPLGYGETGSIAGLHTLDLCGISAVVAKLICGRSQDGSLILDFSHLQELHISIPEHEVLPALQEIFKRAPKPISLCLRATQQCVCH